MNDFYTFLDSLVEASSKQAYIIKMTIATSSSVMPDKERQWEP